jgi:hypothetical protein
MRVIDDFRDRYLQAAFASVNRLWHNRRSRRVVNRYNVLIEHGTQRTWPNSQLGRVAKKLMRLRSNLDNRA